MLNHELHVAVKLNDIELVGHLLRGGTDPNIVNKVSCQKLMNQNNESSCLSGYLGLICSIVLHAI